MKSKSQVLSFLFLLLSVGAGITTGNTPENSPNCKKEPCIILRDSYGRIISPNLRPPPRVRVRSFGFRIREFFQHGGR